MPPSPLRLLSLLLLLLGRPARAERGPAAAAAASAEGGVCAAGSDVECTAWQQVHINGGARPETLELQTTSAVHFDPENSPLFANSSAAALHAVRSRRGRRMQAGGGDAAAAAPLVGLRVLDLGCGTGVWGLIFAATAAAAGEDVHLVFADASAAAAEVALANHRRNFVVVGGGGGGGGGGVDVGRRQVSLSEILLLLEIYSTVLCARFG